MNLGVHRINFRLQIARAKLPLENRARNPALTLSEPCCYVAKRMLRKARKYILLALAVLALGYFLYKFRNAITIEGFSWSMVFQSLRQARLSLFVLAIATNYVCFAIRSFRWMRFSRTLGKLKFWNVYSATLMGFSGTFILGRAGEPVRPVLIARKDSVSIPGMFGVYVLERVFDMAATAVLAGSALLLFNSAGLAGGGSDLLMHLARSAGVLLLIGLVGIIAFLVYFRYHGAEWLSRRLQREKWHVGWRKKIVALLEGFSDGLQGIRTWADLGALLGYSTAHWVLVIFMYTFTMHAFGGDLARIPLSGATLVLAFTMIGSAVQFPGVGGGAQVASFLVLTQMFGIAKEPAATAAIVLWLVSFAVCCIAGLPLLLKEGWSVGELQRIAVEEEKVGEDALIEEAEHNAELKKATEEPRP